MLTTVETLRHMSASWCLGTSSIMNWPALHPLSTVSVYVGLYSAAGAGTTVYGLQEIARWMKRVTQQ